MKIFQTAAIPEDESIVGIRRRGLIGWRVRAVPVAEGERILGVAKKRSQAWHYLIPIFVAFWLIIGFMLTIGGLLVLAVITLAILAVFSFVIIMLARAFQNGV